MVHLWDNLQWRLQEKADSHVTVEAVTWHKDDLVQLFIQQLVMKADGGKEFLNRFRPDIGYLKIAIEADYNFEYRYVPWIEEVIKSMHEDIEFVGSEFMYLVKNETDVLSFQSFTKIHTPNMNTEDEEGMYCLETYNYADLFNEYFYSGKVGSRFAPDAARLLLVGGAL